MPSKNMLPKGHRHRSVRAEYVATRGTDPLTSPIIPTVDVDLYARAQSEALTTAHSGQGTHAIVVPTQAAGLRIDQYLAQAIPDISRSRVQLLIDQGQIHLNGSVAKAKHKVTPGETIVITGSPRPAPLNASPEDIPLDIIFEDEFLAIVNKPAGMMVHAGAAAPNTDSTPDPHDDDLASQPKSPEAEGEELSSRSKRGAMNRPASSASSTRSDPRSSGTLVNALLHHFNSDLSGVGGDLRPGIVHRLDKQTSGVLIVAKDDITHRKLGEMFQAREVHKTYLALVHGHIARRGGASTDDTTVSLPIGRDVLRRTRMTTRRSSDSAGVRSAISHIHVLDRLSTPHGPFTLVEVTIETGRTHQIRVHLQALGHPVVGDSLYGAPRLIRPVALESQPERTEDEINEAWHPEGREAPAAHLPQSFVRRSKNASPPEISAPTLSLLRNFLHAQRLRFTHPRTGDLLTAEAPLPPELGRFLAALRADPAIAPIESGA